MTEETNVKEIAEETAKGAATSAAETKETPKKTSSRKRTTTRKKSTIAKKSTTSTRKKSTTKQPTRGTNTAAKSGSGRVKRGRPKKDTTKTSIKNMPADRLLIAEILQEVSSAKTKAEKVKLLRQWKCNALMKILVINYNPAIVSALPPGEPPYKKNEAVAGTDHLSLHIEQRKLHYYFRGGYPGLKQLNRENMFIRLLEGLHKDEAEMLIYAKDKRLQELYRITEQVVLEAFPNEFGNILGK